MDMHLVLKRIGVKKDMAMELRVLIARHYKRSKAAAFKWNIPTTTVSNVVNEHREAPQCILDAEGYVLYKGVYYKVEEEYE